MSRHPLQRFEGGARRILPFRASRNRGEEAVPRDLPSQRLHLGPFSRIRRSDEDDPLDGGMRSQDAQGVREKRLSREIDARFGLAAVETLAPPRRQQDRIAICHRTLLTRIPTALTAR